MALLIRRHSTRKICHEHLLLKHRCTCGGCTKALLLYSKHLNIKPVCFFSSFIFPPPPYQPQTLLQKTPLKTVTSYLMVLVGLPLQLPDRTYIWSGLCILRTSAYPFRRITRGMRETVKVREKALAAQKPRCNPDHARLKWGPGDKNQSFQSWCQGGIEVCDTSPCVTLLEKQPQSCPM